MFGFLTDIASAVVKVAVTPLALVVDISTKVVTGENP